MSLLNFLSDCFIDFVCFGCVVVDFYVQQYGSCFEDVCSFQMYFGGLLGNVVFGVVWFGLKIVMILCVGDEQMGCFLCEMFECEGCDMSQLQIDCECFIVLVLFGLKDCDMFLLLFVCENCVDMVVCVDEICEDFIVGCCVFVIIGMYLLMLGMCEVLLIVFGYVCCYGVVCIFDIDYWLVLWGLIVCGVGENCYVFDVQVMWQLQQVFGEFDLLVGIEEEFLIVGGVLYDLIGLLQVVCVIMNVMLVVKCGVFGCCVIEGDILVSIDVVLIFFGECVEVFNVFGVGDVFLLGLLLGLLCGCDWVELMCIVNVCGVIVVLCYVCLVVMLMLVEFVYWFDGSCNLQVDVDCMFVYLYCVMVLCCDWDDLCVMVFDYCSQFYEFVVQVGVDEVWIKMLKCLFVCVVEQVECDCGIVGYVGVLIDGGVYGSDVFVLVIGCGWWVGCLVELLGLCLLWFDDMCLVGLLFMYWLIEQVVKCLVYYYFDDFVDLCVEQEQCVLELWEVMCVSGNELLLEMILLCVVMLVGIEDDVVLCIVVCFYNFGVKFEWWKFMLFIVDGWMWFVVLIVECDLYCCGVVIFGLNQLL